MLPRFSEKAIRTALRDTRVVAISGPRQSGKTTLARRFVGAGVKYLTLDDPATLEAARGDPVAFVRPLDRCVIDEIQRAPELLLAIKRSVDEDPRPGRFLVTGSANLLTVATIRESLAGRIEIVPLYPLARAERLRRKRPTFLSRALRGQPPMARSAPESAVEDVVLCGGYPEALKRGTERRRQDWYRAYVDSIVNRDLPDVSRIGKPGLVPKVLELAARCSGRLTNLTEIGRAAALDHKTVGVYLDVLEQLFLVKRLPPWSRNELSRLVKTPKLHFIDSGLLAAMCELTANRLQTDRAMLGPLLESFVYSELLKATAWMDDRVTAYHYRDKDQLEVDFVLEGSAGTLVGVEVTAATTVRRRDFAGLDRLAAVAGVHFIQGIVLYGGDETLPFGERLYAVPLRALWS
jgi:predicted AAA+ superfamily ATPase